MRVVIAPDSFKESLSALQVAAAIEAGWREIYPDADVLKLPVADGGEGTVQALVDATGGRLVEVSVTGPLGEPVDAFYGEVPGQDGGPPTAVIEMAAASGLELVAPGRRNPLLTTSRGTGELVAHALARGARRFVLGVGGSATNDGGAGMLQALGVRLLDALGQELEAGGAALARLARIDVSALDPRVAQSEFQIACDVSNPLTGPQGASAIFGPQKGATPEMVAQLDTCLAHFGEVLKRDCGRDVAGIPGAGAGGGIAAAMLAVLHGRLRPGIEIVAEAVGLEQAIRGADLVITGEGRIDGQSVSGKTPVGVARIAARHGKPVIAIGGGLALDAAKVYGHGIDAVFAAVARPCTLDEALAQGEANLRMQARNVARVLELGSTLNARPRPTTPDR